jgi:uncharacterized C2H2 Zn-finger protein
MDEGREAEGRCEVSENDLRLMIEALKERVEQLESEVEDLRDEVAFCNFVPCAECGVVFRDRDAYGQHVCEGRQ